MDPSNLARHLDPQEQNILEHEASLTFRIGQWVIPSWRRFNLASFTSLATCHVHYRFKALFIWKSGHWGSSPQSFYKKAKALYDAGYEQGPIPLMQSTLLLGLNWEGPEDITENGLFYWTRLSIALAQAQGLHLRLETLNVLPT
ncbi:uncharacterized protein P174DRAFT_425145 [Aspergillus novofumigatus IBT 16806]|uniref:Transcription factor domain-containing protein n=1 Tax=Aspergillus novofumigatus (strain IBT 16806) TaxID=1392255 RepID=A0A2I1BV09_ASPN1|nr:uncharacterized protein P174DRAFT_425145 [Aspergillus novofumigatus IBT 16806]PKX89209.1 hypothetical protein P174DRAFT_425145 [Aspergillus novofumigatus IBT 16806]